MNLTKNIQVNNKKENIIVWLDFDAYSYINFGIIIEEAASCDGRNFPENFIPSKLGN